MKISIHQPEHMPWAGFFHKVNMADVFVVLDNTQYRRRYFQNRNKIRVKEGWQWVTVPVTSGDRDATMIKDVLISDDDARWREDNIESIYHAYCKAPYFDEYWPGLKRIYSEPIRSLRDLNLALIMFFFEKLGIDKKPVLASGLDVSGRKGDLILDICLALKANTYVSGISGQDYMDMGKFADSGVSVLVQEFHHPVYRQRHEPFIPCMSVIDILFNCGDKSMDAINGKGVPVMPEVFH